MDELRRKIKKFREAGHAPGSPFMIDLLKEVLAAFHAIKQVNLLDDRRMTLRLLWMVQGWEDALEREDFEALSREVSLYGIFAL